MNTEMIETSVLPERTPDTVALEIRTLQHQAQGIVLSYAIEIGRRLEEVKEMLPHGAFGPWLKRELDYSQSTANNFMRVFREYGTEQQNIFGGETKSQTFANLGFSKALKLLAVPEDEREQFVQENNVESMSTRELDRAIKERDEARKQAEELQSKIADMGIAHAAANREHTAELAEAKQKVKTLEDNLKYAERNARTREREASALREELESLKARPVEVAVEVDQDAVDRARADAIAEMQAKVDQAEAAKAKAEEKRKAAEDALSAANNRIEDLETTNANAVEELEQAARESVETAHADDTRRIQELERQLAAADPDMSEFKLLYTAWQEGYQKMLAVLGRVAQSDGSKAAKLRNALAAAVENMRRMGTS